MNLAKWQIGMIAVTCSGLLGTPRAWSQTDPSSPGSPSKDRARMVMSQPLPALNGGHLKAVLVEVRYGPGEASTPHSHPCAVIGYVVEGSIRTQLQGQTEIVYKVGETFYEAPNSVHLVSANASTTGPAKLLAFFICDRDAPLSVDIPAKSSPGGTTR